MLWFRSRDIRLTWGLNEKSAATRRLLEIFSGTTPEKRKKSSGRRELMLSGKLDALLEFSEGCRAELHALGLRH